MSDQLEEQLRKKLENYQVEPPEGLWESICERLEAEGYPMGLKPEPARRRPAVRRWWWAAAAVVLALVGLFVVLERADREQPQQANVVSQQPVSEHHAVEPVLAQSSADAPAGFMNGPKNQSGKANRVVESTPEPSPEPLLEETEPELPAASPADSAVPQRQGSVVRDVPVPQQPAVYPQDAPKKSVANKKWSMGLKASGGLLASNNSMQTGRLYHSVNYSGGFEAFGDYEYGYSIDKHYFADSSSSYTVTGHTSKHQLPLRFGLSLQYQLNPRLALLSGIGYTRLSSEFSFPLYQDISMHQRLHYVGIPLGVVWQLWSTHSLSFYCSGGVMVEKCVSVDVDGDYSGTKPWQWSVNGAVGAEYAVMPQLGVYLEPSLGYYFSDGTQLDHYYKEHPLAPSIEFGLRLHVGR